MIFTATFDRIAVPGRLFSRSGDWRIAAITLASLSGACLIGLPSFIHAAQAQTAMVPDASARQDLYAQNYGYPPADFGDSGSYGRGAAQDTASLLVRIDKLENQVRQLTGQNEQMQFSIRRLEDQLKKFQADVDFRLQENAGRPGGVPNAPALKGGQKRGDLLDGPVPGGSQAAMGETEPPPAVSAKAGRRHDAFDPDDDPDAPGVPHPLGMTPPSSRSSETINAPLDLTGGRLRSESSASASRNAAADGMVTAGGTVMAAAPANPAREDFDLALGYYRQKEYENAEKSFTAFLAKNAKSRLAPDAIYYLGETYYQRGRQREAAEQYLKISTHYANSSRAPEAMLRLGQSLNALGAKEQACATFSEIDRKYPNASAQVKAGAEREARRLQC